MEATLGYIHSSNTSGGNTQDLAYTYDEVGNVKTVTDAIWSGTRSFVYDDLNRLTQAWGPFGGSNQTPVTHNYAYDAIGNFLDKAGILYYYCNHPQQPAQPQDCTGPLHPSAVASTSDGNRYTYDANGNTFTGAGRTFTWTVDNRMESVNGTLMYYDYTGVRVKKSGAVTTLFPFTGYEDRSGVITKYIRIGNEIIASKKDGVGKLFYHNDHLGGVNAITDGSGTRCQLNEYDPWGKVSRSEGLTPGTPATCDPTHRFTGQELDPESDIHYYGGRYYDQNLGRFISPDPFVQDPDDPQNLNRYAYVLNSPQNYIDPSGYFSFREFLGYASFFSGIIGGVISSIDAIQQAMMSANQFQIEVNQAEIFANQQKLAQLRCGAECSTAGAAGTISAPTPPPLVGTAVAGGASTHPLVLGAAIGANMDSEGGLNPFGRSPLVPSLQSIIKDGYPGVKYSPINPGPLAGDIAKTFRSATYTQTKLSRQTTLYRVIGKSGKPDGSYWTRVKPEGPLQSIIDLGLDQQWGNTATRVVTARIPAGTTIYEGAAAAQGGLVGGGNQVYIPRVDPKWIQSIQ